MTGKTGCSGSSAHRGHRGHWTMKFPWRLVKRHVGGAGAGSSASYESEAMVESPTHRGVKFRIAKVYFARRVDLMRRVRVLARRAGCSRCGTEHAALLAPRPIR